MLPAWHSSNLLPKLHILVKDRELSLQLINYKLVDKCATYSSKLYVLVDLLVFWKRCKAISGNYILKGGLVHQAETETLIIHIRAQILPSIEDVKPPLQGGLGLNEQNVYKKQAGQRQRIYYFLSAFVFLYFSPHLFSHLLPENNH